MPMPTRSCTSTAITSIARRRSPASASPTARPNGGAPAASHELVRLRSVATSYILGWDRSIAEIFAEDYAQLALAGSEFGIPWLEAPDETVLAAMQGRPRARPAPGQRQAAGRQARVDQPQRQPRATPPYGDPVQPARPEPPRDRDRDLLRRRREAARATLEVRCDRQARRAQDAPPGQDGLRDRPARPRPGRLHRDAHEHERLDQELHPGRAAVDRRPASSRSRRGRAASRAPRRGA